MSKLSQNKQIREWTLGEEIGSGTMGVVYKARHAVLPGTYAVKRIHAEVSRDPDRRRYFEREAAVTVNLNHPNIVRTSFPFTDDDGQLYLPMELLRGQPLDALLQTHAVGLRDDTRLLTIARGIASALAYTHSRTPPVVHRDLKPANIFLLTDNTVKVLDFGLARALDSDGAHTSLGRMPGTPAYMAPEVLDGQPATQASDIYAMGVLLFQLATGRLPFAIPDRASMLSVMRAIEKAHGAGLPRIQSAWPRASARLDDLVANMMDADPERRPPNGSEVLAILDLTSNASAAAQETRFEVGALPERSTSVIDGQISRSPRTTGFLVAGTIAAVMVCISFLQGPTLVNPEPMASRIEATHMPDAQLKTTTTVQPRIDASAATAGALVVKPGALVAKPGVAHFAPSRRATTRRPGMVRVPGGRFIMGCDDAADRACRANETRSKPSLKTFWIDKTEVTVDAYRSCVDKGLCTAPGTGRDCNWGRSGRGRHPVNCVSWHQATEFCRYMGKRLPSEQEWEKAARGSNGRKYPWGNETASCKYAVIDGEGGDGCGRDSTWPVGSKTAGVSPYGAFDMAGNVWEWTTDKYRATGSARVVRGGAWNYKAKYGRASHRYYRSASNKIHYLGFRCVKSN